MSQLISRNLSNGIRARFDELKKTSNETQARFHRLVCFDRSEIKISQQMKVKLVETKGKKNQNLQAHISELMRNSDEQRKVIFEHHQVIQTINDRFDRMEMLLAQLLKGKMEQAVNDSPSANGTPTPMMKESAMVSLTTPASSLRAVGDGILPIPTSPTLIRLNPNPSQQTHSNMRKKFETHFSNQTHNLPPIQGHSHYIWTNRLKYLQSEFDCAIKTQCYEPHYLGVYSVKCNQDRSLIKNIAEIESNFRIGIEVGLKHEIVLAMSCLCKGNPDAILVCNGFKDYECIALALPGRKLELYTVIILEQDEEEGVKWKVVIYMTIIHGCCTLSNIEKGMHWYKKMLETDCAPVAVAKIYYSLISGLCQVRQEYDAIRVVQKLKLEGFSLDLVAYNKLMAQFCEKNNAEKVYKMLINMEEKRMKPSSINYNSLILFSGKHKDFGSVQKMMEQMKEIPLTQRLNNMMRLEATVDATLELIKLLTKFQRVLRVFNYNALQKSGCAIEGYSLEDGPMNVILQKMGVVITKVRTNHASSCVNDWLSYDGIIVNSTRARSLSNHLVSKRKRIQIIKIIAVSAISLCEIMVLMLAAFRCWSYRLKQNGEATNNFSLLIKLDQGEFKTVYKRKLEDGKGINWSKYKEYLGKIDYFEGLLSGPKEYKRLMEIAEEYFHKSSSISRKRTVLILNVESQKLERENDKETEQLQSRIPLSGNLIFCGESRSQGMYTLEQLMRASVELLGRGSVGITKKTVLDNQLIVTVRRLHAPKTAATSEEVFEYHMENGDRRRHQNHVTNRVYFQSKGERLIIHDYHPNGSLFNLSLGNDAFSKMVLVVWKGLLNCENTWKLLQWLIAKYSSAHLEDKVSSKGDGIDKVGIKHKNG